MQDTTNPAQTPTERIAVALFGWEPWTPPLAVSKEYRWYRHPETDARYGASLTKFPDFVSSRHVWPDFTGPTAWGWVDRMQRALKDKDLYVSYQINLHGEVPAETRRALIQEAYKTGLSVDVVSGIGYALIALDATIPQRLAAAVKVIEEAGL